MEIREFYGLALASLGLAALAAYLMSSDPVISGFLAAAAVTGMKYVESRSLKQGRTHEMKKILGLAKPVLEMVLLAGLLLLTVVPEMLAVAVVSTVAIFELFRLRLFRFLQEDFGSALGEDFRLSIVVVSLFASYFNPFFVFYGALLILAVTLYDLVHLVTRLRK